MPFRSTGLRSDRGEVGVNSSGMFSSLSAAIAALKVPAVTPTAKIRKEKSNHLFMRTPCERTGGGILLVDLSLFQFAGDRIDLDGGLEVAGKIHLVFVEGPASEANQQLHARQPDRARENLRRRSPRPGFRPGRPLEHRVAKQPG